MSAIRITLWIAVALALFGLGALAVTGFPLRNGGSSQTVAAPGPGAPLGGPFALVDDEGNTVTEAIFRGKPSVTLFGFTHCPDVCPTGLTQMTLWADELGDDADKLRFVFVTVDPERDTVETMHEYVSVFSDRIIGITGPPDQVHAMTKDYKIFSRKVPLDDGDYTMDHTASMILQDADGNFFGTIDAAESSDIGLAKLKRLVAG
jgi:protein SCO1/2